MDLYVDTDVVRQCGLSMAEFGFLLFCYKYELPTSIIKKSDAIRSLWARGFLKNTSRFQLGLDQRKIIPIIEQMNDTTAKDIKERAVSIAPKLIELFPKGRKPGTNLYWRGNRMEIATKLKKFLDIYGEDYSDEDIIQATKNYVDSFSMDYSFMRVLKYFIWKNVLNESNGSRVVEEISDLATCLENKGQEDMLRTDWEKTLI